MAEERVKRKLTAILSADVKGYSRLMGEDEISTMQTLKKYREVMARLVQEYEGRVIDSPGDNILAEFGSVVDAVECAVKIQKELKEQNSQLPENRRMEFRIGVNLGDVIDDEGRIYGDGVNVASRVEGLAEGGGICVSGTAFDQIGKKLPLGYEYLGEQEVKNIEKPVRVYKILTEPAAAGKVIGEEKLRPRQWRGVAIGVAAVLIIVAGALAIWNFYFRPPSMEVASVEKMAFPLPDTPSIAVLPFTNMSGDVEQEYFSDGLTEEIITALSKIRHLFVVARNSTFVYKGKPIKVKQIAEDLGVGYVLEGSVRKSGDQIRITAQLIDAIKGSHLWAERYDLAMKDVFALQDSITKKVITELQVTLTEGEQARLWEKGTSNIDAYLKFLQGLNQAEKRSAEGNIRTIQLFEEAIAMDPQYAVAYAWLGNSRIDSIRFGRDVPRKEAVKEAFELAKKAVAMDESNADCHFVLGRVYRYKKNHEKALAHIDRALALNPNHVNANFLKGAELKTLGRYEEAISHFERAYRINPFYRPIFGVLGSTYVVMGKYEEAVHHFEKLNLQEIRNVNPLIWLTQAYMGVGREDAARDTVKKVLVINPDMTVDRFKKMNAHFYKDAAILEVHGELLREAGLPETPPLPLPDKPSIAVLPFVNMSGDLEQEYISDGITEEIITALSKVPKMFVIARTSSFKYKGKEVDVRTVGRELGVRYVLEGSVRKSEHKLRITAQLVDAKTGNPVWAERYDRDLKDIFAIYDEITMKVITALEVELTEGETARLTAKGTNNLMAYLNCLRGREHYRRFTKEGNISARRFLKEAIALDPEYPSPYQWLGATHMMDVYFQTTESRKQTVNRAVQLTQKAIALDDSLADAHALLGFLYTIFFRQYEKGIAEGRLAIALNPNGATSHGYFSITLRLAGRYEEAVQMAEKAIRLNPFPPGSLYRTLGWAQICTGSYEEAIAACKRALKLTPNDLFTHLPLTIAYSLSGRDEEARAEAAKVLRLNRKFSVERYAKTVQYKNKTDTERFFDALRKAGLPD